MCIFPDAKVYVLVAITVTLAVHITEIVFAILSLMTPGAPRTIIYLNLTACLALLGGLCVGFYGTIFRKLTLLRVMVSIIIVTIVVKAFIWIICVNKRNNYDKFVCNIWFEVGFACTVLCFLATLIYLLQIGGCDE